MKHILPPSTRKPHQLPFLFFVACLAISSGISSSAFIPNSSFQIDEQKPISVTSELVALPVSVTDANGNSVPGLTRENFQIHENGQPREITLFEQEDTPVSVGLLVDHSSSMESKLPNVVIAVSGFTHSGNPQDEMFVVDFGDKVKVELPGGKAFTSSAAEIQTSILAVSAIGKTALYDAVAAGLDHLRLAHWQKKALIIISDGGDNASWYKYSQILAQARQSQVSIYAVGLVDDFGEEENPKILEQLCKDTGGIVFFPRSGSAIMNSTARIARDLREEYLLGFVPGKEADASFHKIQVHIIGPQHGKLNVRTRSGYSVATPSDASSKWEGNAP